MKNINNIYTVIVTCLILVQVHSQQISSGECKNYDVKIVQDFDASRVSYAKFTNNFKFYFMLY